MQADFDRYRRLRDLLADALDEGPTMLQLQQAQTRWARLRDEVATLKAAGPRGSVSLPMGRQRAGEEIRPGIGGHDQDGVVRAHEGSLRELESHAAEAQAVVERMGARLREAGQKRATLQRLVEDVRRWAAAQQPPVLLPGDSETPPMVTVAAAPAGTRTFWGA